VTVKDAMRMAFQSKLGTVVLEAPLPPALEKEDG